MVKDKDVKKIGIFRKEGRYFLEEHIFYPWTLGVSI